MTPTDDLTLWQRVVRRPQKIWLRRALFQIHLWSGIALGFYIFFMSVTGGVLVYRNELYRATTLEPIVSKDSGPRLTDAELTTAIAGSYPDYKVSNIRRAANPDQAAEVQLTRREQMKARLFDVRTGRDLGDPVSRGFKLVSGLIDLHDNLLAGDTGRKVNGAGAFVLLVLAITGFVIWWPGSKTWRRSLMMPRGVGWKRGNWHLHSLIGFWSFGFALVFALSGAYLCFPEQSQDFVDWLDPPTAANAGTRFVDTALYWLAFLHFGRINGIGIPCSGPGLCDQATKAVWAIFGLAPSILFVTGSIMWWNNTLRPKFSSGRRKG